MKSLQKDDDSFRLVQSRTYEDAKEELKTVGPYKDSGVTEINNNKRFTYLDSPKAGKKYKKKKLQWYLFTRPNEKIGYWYAKLMGDSSLGTGLNETTKEIKKVDIAFIDQNQAGGGEGGQEIISDSGFYMRFGAILSYIRDELIPTEDPSGAPQIGINSSQWGNYMTYYPNQISLDPRVCIVNADIKPVKSDITKQTYGTLETFKQLSSWKNESEGYAWTMNIYVSLQKLVGIMDSNINDEGDLNLFDFLSSICTELNKALGGINNLEPVIDQENNIINIIDSSFSSSTVKKPAYGLEIFGYNPKFKSSNFVRNFGLKTAITKEYANMITIGATAAGYSKGMESTAFSNWSRGYVDRFKEKIKSPNEDSKPDEAKNKYTDEFLFDKKNVYKRLGYKKENIQVTPDGLWNNYEIDALSMDDAIIADNIAIVTEYYKWLNYKTSEETKDKPKGERFTSQTNGFIPMSLNLTLDGISGIKIYNQVHVSARFLPKNYPSNLRFLVTAVNHSLNGQDWETKIETQTIPESMDGTVKASYDKLKEVMFEGTPIIATAEDNLLEQWQNVINNSTFNANGSNTGGSNQGRRKVNKSSTIVPNFKTSSRSIIVRDENHKKKYLQIYKNQLGENFNNFTLRKGNSNPNSFVNKFVAFLNSKSTSNIRIKSQDGTKGGELGNGADISSDLFDALKKFYEILDQPKYSQALPVTITGGNDKYHQGKTLSLSSTYGGTVNPTNTTHTHGVAIDIGSKSVLKDNLVIDALEEAGFTGIIWHDPPHIHANIHPDGVNGGSGGNTPSKPSGGSKGVILITGAEREKTHAQQEAIFKQGYNGTVYGYKPTNIGVEQAQAAIAKNPTFNVVLFSKGANFSQKIIDTMIAKGGNVSNFYVVEPFTPRKNDAWYGVRYGVRYKGVPPTNIQTNTYVNAGYGVLLGEDNPAGPSEYLGIPSKSKSSNHYVALTEMGRRLNS